jgi:hypothetical protein
MAKPNGMLPALTFDHCVVRGQGDLVLGQIPRPMKFVAMNSVVALSGSLLALDVGAGATTNSVIDIELTNVTACLGGNVLNLKSAMPKPVQVLPVIFTPNQCLFLPSSLDGVLIHMDGPDLEADKLDKQFQWKGGANAYGSYMTFLDINQPDMSLKNVIAWQTFIGEKQDTVSKYRVPLSNSLAEAMKLRPMTDRVSDFGISEHDRLALLDFFPSLRAPDSPDKE